MDGASDYVLLWSQSQGAFHVETLKEMMIRNAEVFIKDQPSDWITLAAGLTREDARQVIEHLREAQAAFREMPPEMQEVLDAALVKMADGGTHLNSGTFPDPRSDAREWWCYSTALAPCWLMLHCGKTAAEGVVKNPTSEEWRWAFDCPSNPKLWEDNGRVTLMREDYPS